MICLVLNHPHLDDNEAALRYWSEDCDLVEYRIDAFDEASRKDFASWSASMYKLYNKPGILTIRTTEDGGSWAGSDEVRRKLYLDLLRAAIPGSLAWVDIEHNRLWPDVVELARSSGVGIIRSAHDFRGTASLPVLMSFLALMTQTPGDVIKYASFCHSTRDVDTLVKASLALRDAKKSFIILGMGEYGQISRILAPKLGSMLTYASDLRPVNQGGLSTPAAPGQLDPHTLVERYGYRSISSRTLVYGIIGNPVAHSQSPAWHNPRLRTAGLDAVYVPFLVDDPDACISMAPDIDVRGFSVTIPHKEAVLRFCTETSPEALACRASNTLIWTGESWNGYNTDVEGCMAPLADLFAQTPAKRRRALVLGAGGAARAVLYGLLDAGWQVVIANRNLEKALNLAREFGAGPGILTSDQSSKPGEETLGLVKAVPLTVEAVLAQMETGYTLVVNTTSVGMGGMGHDAAVDQEPLPGLPLEGVQMVYDIIYTPPETALLARARKAGCQTLNGQSMFEIQAKAQLELFVQASRSDM